MKTVWLRAGKHRLRARATGSGDRGTVLLLHGFPDDSSVWQGLLEALAVEGYRAVAPCLVGTAPSDAPAGVEEFALPRLARGLVGLLDDLGVAQAAVVGHDWGAALAWQLALRHPGRVSRLVVISVGHPACGAVAGGLEQRMRWWYLFLFADPNAEALVTANDWALFRELMAAAGARRGDVDASIERLARPGALTSALAWYRANHHPAAIAATSPPRGAPKLRVPALGIYPARDGALTEAQMVGSAAWVEAPERRWRYARIEGSGHWPQRDAPEELAALVLGFLGGGGGSGDSGGGGGGGGGSGGGNSGGGGGGGGGGAPPPRARL